MSDIKDSIIKSLLNTPLGELRSGDTELAIKCPRCSHLHPNSGPHFYISTEEPLRYDCKHCSVSGVLTYGILNELGIFNIEYKEYLDKFNRNHIKKISGNSSLANVYQKNILTKYRNSDKFKLEYLSNRTNIDFFDEKNIKDYKVIINLEDFLGYNKLSNTIKKPNYVNEISKSCIGFLSYNQNVANMRNINSNNLTKYANYKINQNINAPFMYIPSRQVDILALSPRIVVAEGAFDIICVSKLFYTKDDTNTIFGAVGSWGSYLKAIKVLVSITGFAGADLHIYSDKDVNLNDYKKMLRYYRNIFNKVRIIYNEYNKDFGNINEKHKKIIKTI